MCHSYVMELSNGIHAAREFADSPWNLATIMSKYFTSPSEFRQTDRNIRRSHNSHNWFLGSAHDRQHPSFFASFPSRWRRQSDDTKPTTKTEQNSRSNQLEVVSRRGDPISQKSTPLTAHRAKSSKMKMYQILLWHWTSSCHPTEDRSKRSS